MQLFRRILLFGLSLSLSFSALAEDRFPPRGFQEMSSEESPKASFRIVHFKQDPKDFSSSSQIWIQALKPGFRTQLLFTHENRAGWVISDDDQFIAINYHQMSTDGLLYIFSRGKDGVFHRASADFREMAMKHMTTQFKLPVEPIMDHLYCYGDIWIKEGILLGHLRGNYSGVHYLDEWYFMYAAKNNRFIWDLNSINKNAFQLVKHAGTK